MTSEQTVSAIDNSMLSEVRSLVEGALGLGPDSLGSSPDFALLGSVPELDSMAVVHVITALEEQFGFDVDDDDINAATFETLGSLTKFVESKIK